MACTQTASTTDDRPINHSSSNSCELKNHRDQIINIVFCLRIHKLVLNLSLESFSLTESLEAKLCCLIKIVNMFI